MSKIIFAICVALCGASLVACNKHWWPARLQTGRVAYSPELVQDLHDFVDLIPKVALEELITEHLITDSGFRKAVKYLSSSDFKRLQQRAESLPEVIEVINYIHLNDTILQPRIRLDARLRQQLINNYDYKVSDTPSGQREEVLVILLPVAGDELELPAPTVGSLVSFTKEVLTHLPRDRFVALINSKRQSGKVFPKFYEAIRSEQFPQLLEHTMQSQNVINIIKTLASNEIDARSLKEIALDVISWGPAV